MGYTPLQGLGLVPRLITNAPQQSGKTMLYIGASILRQNFLSNFADSGWTIDILEVFPDNVAFLRQKNLPGTRTICKGDVRYASFPSIPYDAIVWWHGPEHIPEEEVADTLARLEQVGRLVVLGGPLQDPPYSESYDNDNPQERHCWSITIPAIQNLGYIVHSVSRPVTTGFVAWKITEHKEDSPVIQPLPLERKERKVVP